jgi:uncharacterized protein
VLQDALRNAGEALSGPLASVSGAVRQGRTLEAVAHRPWPLPGEPWFMGQTWENLLFAHWSVLPEALRGVVPPQLALDTFEGRAWVGVTPFLVRGLRLRRTPPAPGLSTFAEVNVRTYVVVDDRPGIYFFSLDAASGLAVRAARRAYRLPYFKARMSVSESSGEVAYRSTRTSADGPPARLEARYRPRGETYHAVPGSLDHWLTERYCLYTLAGNTVMRGEIHHPPWPLQAAGAEIAHNTMAEPVGVRLEGDPRLHFAARQDVALWPIEEVAAGCQGR